MTTTLESAVAEVQTEALALVEAHAEGLALSDLLSELTRPGWPLEIVSRGLASLLTSHAVTLTPDRLVTTPVRRQ